MEKSIQGLDARLTFQLESVSQLRRRLDTLTANRRFFHGPGFNNTDFGLLKHTVIKESLAFDVRMEFFNIFNHTQFMNPQGDITNAAFGLVSKTQPPRIGQFSLKFYW